ncbi:hypothetical protein L596_011379 [Steinernema carpocapsae]|uniref:Uncharacterized protein n=1 Tax=Steinernema carpocapsae TaxID=34508 RepID=A0A4U5NU76_STECR|nr:hypothetical protein L596_011379 [Steinernema carpocapsae]
MRPSWPKMLCGEAYLVVRTEAQEGKRHRGGGGPEIQRTDEDVLVEVHHPKKGETDGVSFIRSATEKRAVAIFAYRLR